MVQDKVEVPVVGSRGLALVVDDDEVVRRILEANLKRENYKVISAAGGLEALEKFALHDPDIVFLDVMLPDLQGYEVARRIKERVGDRFVPVIFLSGLPEVEALAESVASGGDDFLSKPYEPAILQAKIIAMERIRNLYEKTRVQRNELNQLHAKTQYEQEIAQRIIAGAVMAPNVAEPPVQTLLRAAATFSGDLLLSAYTPSGGISLLLGDFTGHGLSAAIGALPVAEIFRAMTKTGFGLHEVVAEINRKLHRMLPTGMFLAAAALRIEPGLRAASVWNSGLPDVVLRGTDGVRRRFHSQHPPLGAIGEFLPDCRPELIDLLPGDVFVLNSDGVIEACNAAGEMFGEASLARVIDESPPDLLFTGICNALIAFTGDAEQQDDICLAVVPCTPALFPAGQANALPCPHRFIPGSGWNWSLKMEGGNFCCIDPVPLLMNQLIAFGVPGHHRQILFLVVTELFSNALEHGVLGLSSATKDTADGFLAYYSERQQAIESLTSEYVLLEVSYGLVGADAVLTLQVEDSGPGFDHQSRTDAAVVEVGASGRGLALVRKLCKNVTHNAKGNRIYVEYLF